MDSCVHDDLHLVGAQILARAGGALGACLAAPGWHNTCAEWVARYCGHWPGMAEPVSLRSCVFCS